MNRYNIIVLYIIFINKPNIKGKNTFNYLKKLLVKNRTFPIFK